MRTAATTCSAITRRRTARDGRFHRIEVRVKRPGLRVSARRGYASPRGRTPAERKRDEEARRAREAKRGGRNNTSPELRDALNAPLQQSGLTFTVQAAPFKLTQKEASVALAIEFDLASASSSRRRTTAGSCQQARAVVLWHQPGRPCAARRRGRELNLTLRPDSFTSASKPAGCASIRG